MAELKAGTTVGGSVVWHQGNFPLKPTSNDLYYKTYKVYTEYNKPQATDNDFVSKANGGTFAKPITIANQLNIDGGGPYIKFNETDTGKLYYLVLDNNNFRLHEDNISNASRAWQWSPTIKEFRSFGTLVGQDGVFDGTKRVYSENNPPTPTQVGLGNVTNDAQVKKAGDTMTGPLTAPNLISQNAATNAAHVPRLDQVIVKDTIIDFGSF